MSALWFSERPYVLFHAFSIVWRFCFFSSVLEVLVFMGYLRSLLRRRMVGGDVLYYQWVSMFSKWTYLQSIFRKVFPRP